MKVIFKKLFTIFKQKVSKKFDDETFEWLFGLSTKKNFKKIFFNAQ
jgi:hypothetical protein